MEHREFMQLVIAYGQASQAEAFQRIRAQMNPEGARPGGVQEAGAQASIALVAVAQALSSEFRSRTASE